MTAPVFLTAFGDALPAIGAPCTLTGPEAHHAVTVRRIAPGEVVVFADGLGRGVQGVVSAVGKGELTLTVDAHLATPAVPVRWVVAQALAKGDRGELAVELLTEQGVDEVIPFHATRSMLRWKGERGVKGLTRWRSTAREASKQSRRLRIPQISEPTDLAGLCARIKQGAHGVVLHESAAGYLTAEKLPASGEVLLVVGPEGGLTDDELDALRAAGARLVAVSDGVLRTSTAGVVGLAQAQLIMHTSISGRR